VAIYRAQIGFVLDSALPRDIVTINPHFSGDDAQGLADRLKANLIANPSVGAVVPFKVKVYDAKKAPPSYPLAVAEQTGNPHTTDKPREVALCLSYYGTWNRPGFRGRLYIPVYMAGGTTLAIRPTSTQQANVGSFASVMTTGMPTGTVWTVYSRKMGTSAPVTNWWVDDEWDTVRSRGMKATSRLLGTAGP
jgi:hypothetical protein